VNEKIYTADLDLFMEFYDIEPFEAPAKAEYYLNSFF
jgi:hypothetical protein